MRATTRDIRRRIKSVRGTAQITRAMQMVASSKMRKAQQAALNGRPFAAMAGDVMGHLAADASDYRHPLMEQRPVRKRGLIVVSTDKGLCGALNTNLFREILSSDTTTTEFIAVGKKAAQFLARTRRKLIGEFQYHDTPTYGECQAISKFAQELFLSGAVDAVDILYTRFISTLSQRPEQHPLLPLGSVERLRADAHSHALETRSRAPQFDFLFEPDAATVLDTLVVYLLDFRVAQVLLEAKASEHSARMVAMKNATDNANQLVQDLTLEYNKLRQANITKELLDISTAQRAME
jgi:F-type H+-transporting ATPase subunit gamma